MQFHFGPVLDDDGVLFRLWAPLHKTVDLKIDDNRQHSMHPVGDGWHHCHVAGAGPGTLYRFLLPDGLEVPDPASRFQPYDVYGPCEVIRPRAPGALDGWNGRRWEEMVIYELHTGCFTPEGTFLAAIDRLDHLGQLGVTAIQMMPLADFPGRYGWGYDGVLPYAPDSSYGRPEDLRALIIAAHSRGICVFLDVVYNHLGPVGNYLPAYAPLFTDRHRSPWGDGINYDGDGSHLIREFFIENAIYWITEFGFDGLRLDAVHAIRDDSEEHVLHELARRVKDAAGDRHIHLIVENEDNDTGLLERNADGEPPMFTAQWNDDIHHVLHIAATAEDFGYYGDYTDDFGKIGRALAEGFVFQGEFMTYRGETRGKPSAGLPSTAFISFIQNHDQIGNRASGNRMITYASTKALAAVTAIYLLSPQIPMLFMGEEWGAPEPFPYFCDFDEEHNEKVRKGRREELSRLPGFDADDLIDPTAQSTFASGKLDWARMRKSEAVDIFEFYKRLLDIRNREIVPLLEGRTTLTGTFRTNGSVIAVEWMSTNGTTLYLVANLSEESAAPDDVSRHAILKSGQSVRRIFSAGSCEGDILGPWSVIWSVGQT